MFFDAIAVEQALFEVFSLSNAAIYPIDQDEGLQPGIIFLAMC